MDDQIGRQAAIDVLSLGKEILSRVLDDIDVVGTDREKYSWGLGLIESNIEDIKELPSAQPEQQWIPWDSGRFPDDSGTYIVTVYDGAQERVTFARYQKRLKRWELTGARAYWRVLAWMPLPEPYAERGTDEQT